MSWAMEECGCALCQLVAAQCGIVLQFDPQSEADTQTQVCKHRHTQRDENTTKHRPDLKTGINTDNLVYFVLLRLSSLKQMDTLSW